MPQLAVLLTRRWPDEIEQELVRSFDTTLSVHDEPLSAAALQQALREFDVICPTITDRIDAAVLDAGEVRVRAFCNFGAGTNHIDLAACRVRGIAVTNTPDVLTEETADIAITLALMCARRAGEGERRLRAGTWLGWSPTDMLGHRVSGKTLGIVGFGRIGQALARKARLGFGMNIIYSSSRRADVETEQALGATRRELDTLLAEADIVSLHVPGTAANIHMIDARRLALMKSTAIIINTARGGLIDEEALADHLEEGLIASAGLDVHEQEPKVSARLAGLENAVLLPHLGSATLETRVAMGRRVMDNILAIAADRKPPDSVA